MENILYNISQVLGITIIHSIWQALLIYFMLRLALMFSPYLSSSKKYLMAVSSLLAITGWFVYTLVNEIHLYNWLAIKPEKLSAMPLMLELPADFRKLNDQSIRYYYSIEEYLPYITLVYVTGLLFNTTRLILARKKINIIKQTMSIDILLQRQVNKFRDMLNIDDRVKIGLSTFVDVPCMVGYLKPIILLPFTLSTYLTAEEIDSILLHELAHIKRNDYLVNLLQQVISTLLFFNPCAQLINRIINEERENCCDDLVIQSTPSPVIYAKALLKLEQTRENNMRMALSATGKKYQLLNRIERIMKTKKPIASIRPALLAMLILTAGIFSIALLNPKIAQGKISIKAINPAISSMLTDTVHKSKAKSKKLAAAKKTVKTKQTVAYDDYNDAKLEKLSEEINKHGEAINSYYNSPEFKKYEADMEAKSKEIEEYYNRPELKELQLKQEKLSADFEKTWGETEETKKWGEQMGKMGENIEKYYKSPEFKQLNEQLEKKYGIPHNRQYFDDRKDENYRKYEEELQQHVPADVKQQTEELKKLGEQMRGHFDSPEFREKQQEMRLMGDSMRKVFNNGAIKQQQMEMRKLGEQMRAFQNNPQIKKEQELMRQAQARMRAYMNSPEFKNRMYQMKRDAMNYNYNYNFNDDNEKPEKPEKPEAPEKPEKLERPAAPEKPEPPQVPEKPDTTH